MKYDIFISYSRKDAEIIDRIEQELALYGMTCFIDRSGINPGEDYAEVISKALFESELMLFVWSENSNQSKETANEVALAIDFEKQVVPFKIGKFQADYKLAYRLVRFNRIDALTYNEQKIVELGEKLAKQLGRTKVSSTPAQHTAAPLQQEEPAEFRDPEMDADLESGIRMLNEYRLSAAFDILYPLALAEYRNAADVLTFFTQPKFLARMYHLTESQMERVRNDAENGILFAKYFYGTYARMTEEAYRHISEAAEEGYAPAIFALSKFHDLGRVVEQDSRKAIELMVQAMNAGFTTAKNEYLRYIANGLTLTKNLEKATAQWEEMAAKGDGLAAYRLAGKYAETAYWNPEKARHYIDIALKNGYKEAYIYMSLVDGCDKHGNFVDKEKYVNALIKGAELNEVGCISGLAAAYIYGQGVQKNIKSGIRWAKRGAALKETTSMYILHQLYYYGDEEAGIAEDCAEAWKWAMMGAELDDTSCVTSLGHMCKWGDVFDGYTQNDCVKFYKRSVYLWEAQGEAAVELYDIYSQGLYGEPVDMAKAVAYLKPAVEEEHVEACYRYGFLLSDEDSDYCNEFQAVKYLNIAAEGGKAEAYTLLGVLYENGFGVPEDIRKAREMYQTAVELGDEVAKGCLANLG